MNAKQSLKIVAQKLQEAEMTIREAEKDIANYNKCIDAIIHGGSACPWCEEYQECEKEDKTGGRTGCADWWLAFQPENNVEVVDNATDTGDQIPFAIRGATDGVSGGSDGISAGSVEAPASVDPDQSDTNGDS